jgi:ribose/xylose/arabinose/galactoside ABC-type transport system permease subunit
VLNNGMDLMHISAYYQQVTKGVIIVLAVILDKARNK